MCTGIRFPVGMAFNSEGDLFATDQEGATWLPNGNPFDELLHIQPGRHYGFPPRHPKHLPDVIDEPSVFDYAPQHQSTCGLLFNEPVNGGPVFGPAFWRGNAIVCGESRGKLYRTQLAKTAAGYVARNQVLASLTMLTIDACVSPQGDLVVTTHSGNPDWGSGPKGKGRLYKIRYAEKTLPQPVACWAAGPHEVRVAFDRALEPSLLREVAKNAAIEFGAYVGAGDRFEKIRPGYEAVQRQITQPRGKLAVTGVQVTADRRTLVLGTAGQSLAVNYGLNLPGLGRSSAGAGEVRQVDAIDLAYDLCGVQAEWQPDGPEARRWSGWLPHVDLAVCPRLDRRKRRTRRVVAVTGSSRPADAPHVARPLEHAPPRGAAGLPPRLHAAAGTGDGPLRGGCSHGREVFWGDAQGCRGRERPARCKPDVRARRGRAAAGRGHAPHGVEAARVDGRLHDKGRPAAPRLTLATLPPTLGQGQAGSGGGRTGQGRGPAAQGRELAPGARRLLRRAGGVRQVPPGRRPGERPRARPVEPRPP